jgi:hypothetical protein
MNRALNILGVPTAFDPAAGITAGGSFLPSSIHPTNQSRSDARRAYYDPYIHRSNFHVATSQQATRIVTELGADGTVTTTGVEVHLAHISSNGFTFVKDVTNPSSSRTTQVLQSKPST